MHTDYIFIDQQEQLIPAITAELAYLDQYPVLTVDTETKAYDAIRAKVDVLRDKVVLLQLGAPKKSLVIDCRKVNIEPLRSIFENRKITKVAHNAKFDYSVLKMNFGIELNGIFDTMVAERLLTCGVGSKFISLASIARTYLNIEMNKDVRNEFSSMALDDQFTLEQIQYSALDAAVLHPLYEILSEKLAAENLTGAAQLEFGFVEAVSDMELNGCRLDTPRWRQLAAEVYKEYLKKEMEVQSYFRDIAEQPTLFDEAPVINLGSNPQLLSMLHRLGVTILDDDGKDCLIPDTNDDTLAKSNHPVIAKLRNYRKYKKLTESYGVALLDKIHPKTQRLHPKFEQIGADTGRQSSENPNVQQIPSDSEFRDCFISSPGYKLVCADYSQCELRILAALSNDPVMIEAFKSGRDFHASTAGLLFDIPYEEIDQRLKNNDSAIKDKRKIAKTANFLIVYGGGEYTLSARAGIPVPDAKQVIAKYYDSFVNVSQWLSMAGEFAKNNGYSLTRSGRKRYYDRPDPYKTSEKAYARAMGKIERQGKNSPIQGGNADVTKLACIYLKEEIRPYDAKLIFTVHDEILIEAHESCAEQVGEIMKTCMIKAFNDYYPEVPMVCDVKLAEKWVH